MIKIKHTFVVECDTLEEVEYTKAQCEELGYTVKNTLKPKKFTAECYEEREKPVANKVENTETPQIKEI